MAYGFLGDPGTIIQLGTTETTGANAAASALTAMAGTLVAPTIQPNFPTVTAAPAASVPATPNYQQVVWSFPALPSALSSSLVTSDLTVPAMTAVAPTLNLPATPDAFSGTAPAQPAVDLNFTLPTLSVSLPAAPNLLSISVSPFAGVTIPTFTETAPTSVDLVAPTVREYQPGAAYTSSLLTAVKASLEDRITNGGSGLAPAVEQAIWDRGREREYRAQADALLDLEKQAEVLGFMFPPGVYLDARLRLATETNAAMVGHSREVMIQAAQLELDNVKHALTTATELEGRLLDYTNAVEQRLFEAAKYATEGYIAIYNAKVQAYGVSVQAYAAKINAYDALIRGLQMQVEVYKIQIEAEQIKAQVNTALVEQYKAQSEVALSAIEIYKAEIGAIQAQADIQKIKVEVFGAEVQAYASQINAYTAGIEAYRAQLQAEGTKQQIFATQVQAFSAQVDANVKQIEARIESYKGLIAGKQLEYQGYQTAIAGQTAGIQAAISNNQVLAETFRSTVTATASYNDLLTKQWQVALEQSERVAEIGVQAAKANAEMYISTRSLATDAAKVSAQVYAQLGAAALNSVHWSNSVSVSDSTAMSTSFSNSKSDSTAHSYSDSNSNSKITEYIYSASTSTG